MRQSSRSWIGIHVTGDFCEDVRMEQRETRRHVLDRMVSTGQLTSAQAEEIRFAPEWSFTARELVSYLSGLIILSGSVRIIALAFEDASQEVIGTVLMLVGAILGAVAWRLPRRTDAWGRFAEVVEGGALLSLGGGAGVLLDLTDLSGQTIVLYISIPLVLWAWWRSARARFVGSAALCAGVPMLTLSAAAMISEESAYATASGALAAGAVLWVVGQRQVGSSFLQRGVGCYFLLMGAFIMGGEKSNDFTVIVPIVIGAVLFMLGSMSMQVESLVAGAIGVTIGTTIAMSEWLPSEFTRGITTIAVGAVMLFATLSQMRKHRQSTSA